MALRKILFTKKTIEMKNEIKDGIVCSSRYNNAKYKVLWVLKEGNVDEADKNSERDICNEFLNDQHKKDARAIPTFRKIIYSTYGILNPDISWLNIPVANKEAYEVIKEIAYVNINKSPGGSVSNENVIRQKYQKKKNNLLKQIKDINPQIAIFGGTEQFFPEEDLKSIGWDWNSKDIFYAKAKDSEYEVLCFSNSKDRLIICPAHPAYFKVSDKDYCTAIHNAVREWENKNFK